jgi:hypothetical protein
MDIKREVEAIGDDLYEALDKCPRCRSAYDWEDEARRLRRAARDATHALFKLAGVQCTCEQCEADEPPTREDVREAQDWERAEVERVR